MAQLSNDDFTNATFITGFSGTVTGSTLNATTEDNEMSGYSTVWFRWTAPSNGWFQFDTAGSGFDTTLLVQAGLGVYGPWLLGSNDDSLLPGYGAQSSVGFPAVTGQEYFIRVGGHGPADQGNYTLNWTNLHEVRPANDDFAAATLIEGASGTSTSSTVFATFEPDDPGSFVIANSVWWRWTAPTTEPFTFEVVSSCNTLLAIYTGTALTNLAFEEGYSRSVSFPATNGTVYYIRVAGLINESGAVTLSWHPALPPANDNFTNATPITESYGQSRSYLARATVESGEPSPALQTVWWRFTLTDSQRIAFLTSTDEGVRLLSAFTGPDLASLDPVPSVSTNITFTGGNPPFTNHYAKLSFCAEAGRTYYVRMDGTNEAPTPVFLNWFPEVPENDNLSLAHPVILSGSSGAISGNNCGATVENGEPAGANTVWFLWSALDTYPIRFDTFGSTFDTVLDVYGIASSTRYLQRVASNDDSGEPGNEKQSAIQFQPSIGQSYWIRVGSHTQGEVGPLTLHWGRVVFPPPSNDSFLGAAIIAGWSGSTTGTTFGATSELSEFPVFTYETAFLIWTHDDATNSVWWHWTAPADARMEFTTCGSSFSTFLTVYSGETLETATPLAANADAPCSTWNASRVVIDVTNGQSLYIRVAGRFGEDGNAELSWQTMVSPTNDFFTSAMNIAGVDGIALSQNFGATFEVGEPAAAIEHTIWWRWTCPLSGAYLFRVVAPADSLTPIQLSLSAFTGTDLSTLSNVTTESASGSIFFIATPGQTYCLRAGGSQAFITLQWWQTQPGLDGIEAALPLAGGVGTISSNTYSGSGVQWWSWTAPRDMQVQFHTLGSSFDTRLWAFSVAPEADTTNYTQVAYCDDIAGPPFSLASKIEFFAAAGTTYCIRLDGYAGATGNFNLNWQCAPAALSIVGSGTNAVLTWPAGYTLQGTTELQGPATLWTNLATQSDYTNSSAGTRFFRLICQ